MSEFKEEIEEARARVAQCRIRAERPSARLEEEYALEKARNRLLTLELKDLKQAQRTRGTAAEKTQRVAGEPRRDARKRAVISSNSGAGTKRKQIFISERHRAEVQFSALQEGIILDKEGR